MKPAASRLRTASAGALAVALALVLTACSPRVELMSAMPEHEANEVMAALLNAGIPADKVPGKEGMVGISLEASQVGRAVDLLRAKGLPRERFAGMGQVFRKEGLISSPMEERARYLYALSQELGATLSQLDGVIVARVHVVLPERGSVGDPNLPSSAAVFIKHQDGYNVEAVQPQIRRLVVNSIPGLTADKVSLVLVNSQAGPVAAGDAPAKPPPAPEGVSSLLFAAVLVLLAAALACAGWLGWRQWKSGLLRIAPAGATSEA